MNCPVLNLHEYFLETFALNIDSWILKPIESDYQYS